MQKIEPSLLDSNLLVSIVESSDDVIISQTLRGVITSWNSAAERLFEYSKVEAIGKHISLIIPRDRLAEEDLIIAKISRGEKVNHFQTIRVAKSGKEIALSINVSLITKGAGEIMGVSKVARDITDLKKAAANLALEVRRKDEFIAMLAHELRNPLSPILNSLSILQLGTNRSEQDSWALGIMERQITNMTRLIDDLLDIGRISVGKLDLQREPISIEAVIQLSLESSRPYILDRKHELIVQLPMESLFVNGDKVRLSQIILNLLNNAAKYTDVGGKIWLTVAKDYKEVVVTVKDSGIGIDEKSIENIFDLFSQGSNLSASITGLGIGLALVKTLTEKHGGSVTVKSPGVGLGTTFTVRLPLMDSRPKDEKAELPNVPVSSALNILVVDDNVDAADSFNLLLQQKGWNVKTAYDGLEALQLAKNFKPDILLLDIGMPKLNGYEVAKLIRNETWGKKALVIATTGWGQDSDKKKSYEAGFDHHLVKPIILTQLEQIISIKFGFAQ